MSCVNKRFAAMGLVSTVCLLLVSDLCAQPGAEELQRRIQQTIREMGTVVSGSAVDIRCEVPGQSTILWVIEEGTSVKPGDELLRLDASPIDKQVSEQRILLSNARVTVESAKATVQSLKLRRATADRTLALQRRAGELARAAMLGEEGELQQQIQEAKSQIKIAEARVAAALSKLKQWEVGHDGKQSPAELKLEHVEADEMLRVANKRRQFLEKVLKPAEEARFDLEQSKEQMKLQAETLAIERDLGVAEGKLNAAMVALDTETQRYDRLVDSLKSCVIKAPQAGTVVYHNQRSSRGATGFIVEEGATVRERQIVLKLPDLSKLQVRTLVNETRISQVRPGQQAVIIVDALPNEKFRGVVRQVSRVAEPTTFLQNTKSYAVTVDLMDAGDVVRIGMTALVEIQAKPARQPAR